MHVFMRLVGLFLLTLLTTCGCATSTQRIDPHPVDISTAISPQNTNTQRPSSTIGPSPEQWQAIRAVQDYPVGESLGLQSLNECMALVLAMDSAMNGWQLDSVGWYSELSIANIWNVTYNFTKDGKATNASWKYDQRTGSINGDNEYGQLILSTCR